MPRIHSYVVRYDSGFAPNPFYGLCTLATCKPDIRKSASINDWVVGSGSNDRSVRRGGHLVYAMRVSATLSFDEYNADQLFQKKKPYRLGSRKQSCGDNIYFRDAKGGSWCQRDSFHSRPTGQMEPKHILRDTGVDRVLISDDFVYFGGQGPTFPAALAVLCKIGRGRSCFDKPQMVGAFVDWIRSLGVSGYQGAPYEWTTLRG